MLAAAPAARAEGPARPPNFLIIVADDLGWSDIGAFGGEIDTPNLDTVAARALKLTGFHTADLLANPLYAAHRSRSPRGRHRQYAELIAPNQKGKPGYEGYLRPDTATLAELLSANGYRTLGSLQLPAGQQSPVK